MVPEARPRTHRLHGSLPLGVRRTSAEDRKPGPYLSLQDRRAFAAVLGELVSDLELMKRGVILGGGREGG